MLTLLLEQVDANEFELKFLIKQAFIRSSSISIFILSSFVIAVFNVKSINGNIFGGYTEQSWCGNGSNKADPNAFIFSLINKHNRPLKMKATIIYKLICPMQLINLLTMHKRRNCLRK